MYFGLDVPSAAPRGAFSFVSFDAVIVSGPHIGIFKHHAPELCEQIPCLRQR